MKVLFETKGPIAYVTINRPSCSTPATSKPTNAWPRCGQKFREDASLRVGILIGVGDRASCARSDIKSNYIAHRREEPHNLLLQVLLEGNAATLLHLDKEGDRGQSLVSLRELMSISESWIDVSYFPTP